MFIGELNPAKIIIKNPDFPEMAERQKTASGREVKQVGMTDSKKSAMQRLREARETGKKRTDQYQVNSPKFDLVGCRGSKGV